MQRAELAHFLRAARARVAPGAVGMPCGPHRRVPGLRREEVARLATISVDTYTRLEQARGATPSVPVVEALARGLRLSRDERAHLFQLTGQPQPGAGIVSQEITPTVFRLLERMDDTAAFILDAAGYVLAWNPLAAALVADFSRWSPEECNLTWQVFCGTTGASADYGPADWEAFARDSVADLRAAHARYPDDPRVTGLIGRLRAGSEQFVTWWDEHRVAARSGTSKRMHHPAVGDIDLDLTVLLVPDHDQRVIIYSAQPGTPSADALRLLAVIGTQTLS